MTEYWVKAQGIATDSDDIVVTLWYQENSSVRTRALIFIRCNGKEGFDGSSSVKFPRVSWWNKEGVPPEATRLFFLACTELKLKNEETWESERYST